MRRSRIRRSTRSCPVSRLRVCATAAVIGLATLALLACSVSTTTTPPSTGTSKTLSGNANFSSGPLPSDAEMVVTIQDNSASNSASATLGEVKMSVAGKTAPIPFGVPYNVSEIDPTHLYAVQATITAGAQPLFVTKGNTLVITQGRPTAGVSLPMKQP